MLHLDRVAHMRELLASGREDLSDPARWQGRGTPVIPDTAPGKTGEEAHSPVKRTPRESERGG